MLCRQAAVFPLSCRLIADNCIWTGQRSLATKLTDSEHAARGEPLPVGVSPFLLHAL
jgi:hypothetical protein